MRADVIVSEIIAAPDFFKYLAFCRLNPKHAGVSSLVLHDRSGVRKDPERHAVLFQRFRETLHQTSHDRGGS